MTSGAGFTIEKVAALAEASRMTIYKWWPSKGTLAQGGYFTVVAPTLAVPDTGDIVADLTDQLVAFVHLVRDTSAGRVISQLIGQAQTRPGAGRGLPGALLCPRRALAVEILTRAMAREQLRSDVDPESVVGQLWGACYHRLLIADLPLTEDFARTLVDNLVRGLR
ncbi:TetR-like C-terminal domain-containing protein [Micromonospora musae]|uniref:TetR-like C-terminal domain-containing protein n=1 Tax=Micromonospora musae TaxID=1894970 RepID=UPI0033D07E3B